MSAAFDEMVHSVRSFVKKALPAKARPMRNVLWKEKPSATYERVIQEKLETYSSLREAVAGVLYLRHRLEGDCFERRAEIARIHAEAKNGAEEGDDDRALMLLEHKHRLLAELSETEEYLDQARKDATKATQELAQLRAEIRSLEREKLRTVTTLTAAETRAKLHEAAYGEAAEYARATVAAVRERVAAAREAATLRRAYEGLDTPELLDDPRDTAAKLDLAVLRSKR